MSEQIDSALRWGSERIAACSESARLDAELLLAHCLDKPRSFLYARPEQSLSEASWQEYQRLGARLTGKREENLRPTAITIE